MIAHVGTTALDLANTVVVCLAIAAVVITVALIIAWHYNRQDDAEHCETLADKHMVHSFQHAQDKQ